jgi:hypothetical protein
MSRMRKKVIVTTQKRMITNPIDRLAINRIIAVSGHRDDSFCNRSIKTASVFDRRTRTILEASQIHRVHQN